jgi:alpha-L-rhamnosidase
MKRVRCPAPIVSWLVASLFCWAAVTSGFAKITITDLRCESLVNPVGIDATQPRLSWILNSNERGARQTAYQVLVASSPAKLKAGQGDWWDSSRVESDQSIQLPYAGKPLRSYARCFW